MLSSSSSDTQHQNAIYTSRPLSKLISATVNASKKRNIDESNIETQNDQNNGMKFLLFNSMVIINIININNFFLILFFLKLNRKTY